MWYMRSLIFLVRTRMMFSHKIKDLVLARTSTFSSIVKKMGLTTGAVASETKEDPWQHLEIQDKDLESEESLWNLYERWAIHYKINRAPEEKHTRFELFKENVKDIHDFNKKGESWKAGLNKFTDWTNEEFRSPRIRGFIPPVGRYV